MSEPHTPQAATLTSTWPGPGVGTSTSSTRMSPGACSTAAVIRVGRSRGTGAMVLVVGLVVAVMAHDPTQRPETAEVGSAVGVSRPHLDLSCRRLSRRRGTGDHGKTGTP